MPELPEAETIARGLRETLPGRRVDSVEILHPDLLGTDPREFVEALPGHRVRDVRRRGKNPIVLLETPGSTGSPGPDAVLAIRHLVVNLGMTGRLTHRAAGTSEPSPSHPGVRVNLDDGSVLLYTDVRRFGRLRLLTRADYRRWSRALGPEPLSRSFTGRSLENALAASRAPIRSWLLDQRRLAGVGNIYANEALFRAGVHPRAPAKSIPADATARLHRALRAVLRESVRAQGTTLRDYRTANGERGSYATRLRVYDREGEPCRRCGRTIERTMFGGRSAFHCPGCQPAPREDS